MVTLKPKHLYFYCWLRWAATSHAEGRCVTGAFVTGSNYKNIALKESEGAWECVFKKGFYIDIKPESLKSFSASPFAPAEHWISPQPAPLTRTNPATNFKKHSHRFPRQDTRFARNHLPRGHGGAQAPPAVTPAGQGPQHRSPAGQVQNPRLHRGVGRQHLLLEQCPLEEQRALRGAGRDPGGGTAGHGGHGRGGRGRAALPAPQGLHLDTNSRIQLLRPPARSRRAELGRAAPLRNAVIKHALWTQPELGRVPRASRSTPPTLFAQGGYKIRGCAPIFVRGRAICPWRAAQPVPRAGWGDRAWGTALGGPEPGSGKCHPKNIWILPAPHILSRNIVKTIIGRRISFSSQPFQYLLGLSCGSAK